MKKTQHHIMNKINNIIGWVSAFIIVLAYYLLSTDVFTSKDIEYNVLNLIGGTGLAYRVWVDRNYSNLALEVVFILIAIKSIIN